MRYAGAAACLFAPVLILSEAAAASNEPVLYRLTRPGEYQWGCLKGPCDCAVRTPEPIVGTFYLQLKEAGPLFTEYLLTDISWYVQLPDGRLHLTGEGTYRVGGEVAVVHQMELTLKDNDGQIRHYDSELVPGGNAFPRIDIQTWVTGSECVTSAIRVVAEPAPYTVYRLGEMTTYVYGCFDGFCLCPISGDIPMQGTFLLVQIAAGPLSTTHAIKDIRWTDRLGAGIRITGDGLYELSGHLAVMQRMELDITVTGEPGPDHLESDVVPAYGFPAIDIRVSTHTDCFNRRFDLQARPAGDFDLDGDVALDDYERFLACSTGPEIEQPDWNCHAADIDGDADVDQSDFSLLQRCYSGQGTWMDPRCGD